MPEIAPKKTQAELSALNGQDLGDGTHLSEALPGVLSDSKLVDPNGGHKENRELHHKIRQVVKDTKKTNNPKQEAQFLIAWRLYPNKDHPRWQGTSHSCGCGCGCS